MSKLKRSIASNKKKSELVLQATGSNSMHALRAYLSTTDGYSLAKQQKLLTLKNEGREFVDSLLSSLV